MRFDVCVVGAGPAGALRARLAARAGRSVALIDGGPRRRPPLETLSPVLVRLLEDAGLAGCLEASGSAPGCGIDDAWSSDVPVERSAIANPWGAPRHVVRARFDAALRQAAQREGVRWIESKVEHVTASGSELTVTLTDGRLLAREIVDATGTAGRVARLLGVSRRVLDRQLALSFRVPRHGGTTALRIASLEHGWCYGIPTPDGELQVSVITDGSVRKQRGERALLGDAAAALDVDAPPVDGSVQRSSVLLQTIVGPLPRRFEAVGDALWTPDPLSGQGLLHAALSALSGRKRSRAPALSAIEHVRQRARHFASTPWSSAPFYRNRLAACHRAEEMLHGH